MRKYLAELIGTFALVFCGTGAIIINEISGGEISNVGVGITFGLIILTMIYTFGHVSGAHFNPAVTLGFAMAVRFDNKEIIPYVLSQITGALIATLILRFLFPESISLGATLPSGSQFQSFVLEFILTFLLMLVILQVSQGSKELGLMAGIAIGAVIGLEAIFAGPISGASMNPARSISPAIVSNNFTSLWIYMISPIAGAAFGALTWKLLK